VANLDLDGFELKKKNKIRDFDVYITCGRDATEYIYCSSRGFLCGCGA
jgi:hypothetical protein